MRAGFLIRQSRKTKKARHKVERGKIVHTDKGKTTGRREVVGSITMIV